MGRSVKTLPNLVHRVARTLHFVIQLVEQHDIDGNGELDPEELMEVPFIQNAAKNFYESKDGSTPYLDGSEGEQEQEYDENRRMEINEHLIM
ncbi:hypothetical protein JTE90_023111 [Oedothorax gibbosus]|uniref:EF-hand domain-containing protein n=1 Tax=Oedothorax gibbosus TaxID=931172 RepID=A0AAV6UMF1_9ARAC|nr:hypothetical protein JTE90_023111 [Oedothorax gibbosus]